MGEQVCHPVKRHGGQGGVKTGGNAPLPQPKKENPGKGGGNGQQSHSVDRHPGQGGKR